MYILWSNWVQKHQQKFLGMLFHFAQSISKIQRKFQKIQRKNVKVSILPFWALKPIQNLFNGIGLHSWGPDASFDTHIAISIHYKCQMPNASFMSKMPKMPYLTHIPSDSCHIYTWQYGCQKMRQDLRNADQCH